jgi:hypothetical protein
MNTETTPTAVTSNSMPGTLHMAFELTASTWSPIHQSRKNLPRERSIEA